MEVIPARVYLLTSVFRWLPIEARKIIEQRFWLWVQTASTDDFHRLRCRPDPQSIYSWLRDNFNWDRICSPFVWYNTKAVETRLDLCPAIQKRQDRPRMSQVQSRRHPWRVSRRVHERRTSEKPTGQRVLGNSKKVNAWELHTRCRIFPIWVF